jgi:hypothetical protein
VDGSTFFFSNSGRRSTLELHVTFATTSSIHTRHICIDIRDI